MSPKAVSINDNAAYKSVTGAGQQTFTIDEDAAEEFSNVVGQLKLGYDLASRIGAGIMCLF